MAEEKKLEIMNLKKNKLEPLLDFKDFIPFYGIGNMFIRVDETFEYSKEYIGSHVLWDYPWYHLCVGVFQALSIPTLLYSGYTSFKALEKILN